MNNILFCYPRPKEKKKIRYGFSLNIAYASALLKKTGYNTFFIDLSCNDINLNDLSVFLQKNSIKVVVIEFDAFALKRSDNSLNGEKIINYLKLNIPDIKIIAFGFECMIEKRILSNADITITQDVLACIVSAVDNVLIKKNSYRYKSYDLDDLPYPDRKLIETELYYHHHHDCTLIQTARGCLNSCTFCQRQGWQKVHEEHSLKYVVNEFRWLSKHKYRNIWVVDENFTYNLDRAKNILRELLRYRITSNMKLAISSWTHIDDEFLQIAHDANVSIISMGIESANTESLKFYKKNIDLDHVKYLVNKANEIGVFMVGNFIIGAPNETINDIKNTFSFIEELQLDQVNIKILDYMAGSQLYERLDRKKYPHNHYFSCAENDLSDIPLQTLKDMKNNFMREYIQKNKKRIIRKISRFGTPYYSMK